MTIQEEYIRRHGLGVLPFNYTMLGGSVVLCTQEKFTQRGKSTVSGKHYAVLSMNWIPSDRHPGQYRITTLIPAHDSYQKRELFCPMQEPLHFQYDELEAAIQSIQSIWLSGVKAAVTEVEVAITYWEMFLRCFDGWIARNASPKLLFYVEASMDPSVEIDVRYGSLLVAVDTLRMDNSAIYETWEMQFSSRRNGNLPWLARILNGD